MAKPGPVIALVLLLGPALLAACGEPDAIGAGSGEVAGEVGPLAGALELEPQPGPAVLNANDPGRAPDGGQPTRDSRCAEGNGGIKLMPGFCAAIVADDLGRARHLAVSPSGDLYVALLDEEGPMGLAGGLLALRDADDDGVVERIERITEGGGNGVAWHQGKLYFAQDDRVVSYEVPDGRLVPARGDPDVVVEGLPAMGDHTSKSIAVADDGTLYVSIASATNSCQLQNRQPGSLGVDPCPELENRAGIWSFEADQTHQTLEDGLRFATGLRNGNALAIHRPTGELVALQNGRDELFEDFPEIYSEVEGKVLPAEELFVVDRGDDFGWPYCYFDGVRGMKLLAPEYGGDGETAGRCATAVMPDAWFPAHWSPLGLQFLEGRGMPQGMKRGMLVAFHGSWHTPDATTRGPLPGYQVAFVPFERGEPTSQIHPFAWNFAGDDRPLPENARFRPVGIAHAPDGSIYLSDDQKGRIWRIFYYGG